MILWFIILARMVLVLYFGSLLHQVPQVSGNYNFSPWALKPKNQTGPKFYYKTHKPKPLKSKSKINQHKPVPSLSPHPLLYITRVKPGQPPPKPPLLFISLNPSLKHQTMVVLPPLLHHLSLPAHHLLITSPHTSPQPT